MSQTFSKYIDALESPLIFEKENKVPVRLPGTLNPHLFLSVHCSQQKMLVPLPSPITLDTF
jgi:hypothetical protein